MLLDIEELHMNIDLTFQKINLLKKHKCLCLNVLNRKLYINYGGRDLNDVGGFTTNTPKELQVQESFNVYANDLLSGILNGKVKRWLFLHKGNDGLVYTNADEIKKVKQVEEQEFAEALQNDQRKIN